jgi:hypothetical protein
VAVCGSSAPSGSSEDEDLVIGEQRTGEAQPRALALRQPPAGLADDLSDARGHAFEQRAEAELAADGRSVVEVVPAWRPVAAHEQVERHRREQDVVVAVLRHEADAVAPAGVVRLGGAERDAAAGGGQPGERCGERGLAGPVEPAAIAVETRTPSAWLKLVPVETAMPSAWL